ncbi:type I polyketide synthase [Pseudomonas sp. BP8]|uniref:type I polyketide synthase n=1 Tax=Pseudomonas sp. BP8 TaxID=2817864 RepID=UPI001AE4FEFA|nr:type I polyketide synthase [Pseudomonas sp. BP8]MBP2263677.1 acyl transferase domain-containing protein/NADPH:quinone reductase-like Zn-dependent oxidoreductase/acyl carrier protein/NADP-dependent 3-hydroxy acid dehydrogenase YdfG [Pseudomonas sp. BP8]HDS1734775.1 SDR family NAD(P)-dependent oxidoreductase [Pseudomonas putida]
MTKRKQVAIVGSSFRFPGSTSASFWQNLMSGRDLVTQVDPSRWEKAEFLHPDKTHPASTYTFASGTLGDISGFDAGFFNISPREAAMMDPQQRILLEMCWETFESAGVKPSRLRGSNCGVYLGIASVEQAYRLVDDMAAIDGATATGNTMSIAANRLSYFYDLRGPSMAIDTACSSSLVAFHQACQAILSGDVDQAITGGISLHLHPFGFMIFSKATMLSRTGRCQSFDQNGDGYARSEGGGLFLLKDYDQALADGNPILAVVAASAVNTDGRKSSLTLPNATAQAALLKRAYAKAGIAPEQLDYLEAHGTGTAVGDPIETRAIGEALGQARGAGNPLPIGSVKSNLGHLEAASGVAGLVKAINCLTQRTVPATIGVQALNPTIEFSALNLQVVTEPLPLKREGQLTVGINSFGFGGANAHVILQSPEPLPVAAAQAPAGRVPLLLSAKTEQGLRASAERFAAYLAEHPEANYYDVAYQAMFRRDAHAHRLLLIADSPAEAAQALDDYAQDPTLGELSAVLEAGQALDAAKGPVFVYSGNGSQWQGMGRALLDNPLFAAAVNEVDALFQPLAGYSLRAELLGDNGEGRYARTEIAQPALFALQVAVTRVLAAEGVRPVAVIGHSVGEVAAAWASGALSLADATQVIFHRSRLQGLTRGTGQMTAVGLSGEATAQLIAELGLDGKVVVAGENSARGATVAGDIDGLSVLEEALAERQVFARRLDLDYAFHSPAMNPIEQDVIADLAHIRPRTGDIPFYSTVVGGELDGQRLDSHYWWQNIRFPVLFQGATDALVRQGLNLFVEVGPHPILRSYLNDVLNECEQSGQVIGTLKRNDHSPLLLERSVARVLIAGAEPEWPERFALVGQAVNLPGYAWQRDHFQLPVSSESAGVLRRERVHPLLGYPLADQALTWENRLDTQMFPTLADHKVGESVLFPGAGFTELALAVAQLHQPGEFVDIEELEIHNPLLLGSEGSKKIRVQVEEADGTLRITSRSLAQREDWVQHVVARLPGEARGVLLEARAPALPQRPADFDGEQHLALTRAVGLNYGPAYQTVAAAWVEEQRVLAQLTVPSVIEAELAGLHLHPALLDGAFQLITELLASRPGRNRGLAFIPVKLGRIAFTQAGGVPVLAELRQRKRTEHSLLVDITLFDASGAAVLAINDARLRAVRLNYDRTGEIKRMGHVGIAAPGQVLALQRHAVAATPLAAALQGLADEPAQARYLNEVEPLLEMLCASFLVDLVEQAGGRLSAEQIALWSQHQGDFIASLLRHAEQDLSLLPATDGSWQLGDSGERPSSAAIWQELFQSYPEYFQIIHSVGRIGQHLQGLLDGQLSLDSLLPRETSGASLARLVLGAAGQQRLLAGISETLTVRLAQLPQGQRLRVLEIGFTGASFAELLYPSIDFDRIDFVYCVAEPELEQRLRDDCPALSVINREQLADAGGFDWVLLPSDLAALGAVGDALRQACAQLNPHGQLALLGQYPARWADFVFGGQADWWLAGPQHALSRQQSPAFWQHELQRHGLLAPRTLEALPGSACGSYLLLADKGAAAAAAAPAPATAHWALLAEAGQGAAALLAEQLRGHGQQVSLLLPGDAQSLAAQLAALDQAPQHLLHLAGFDSSAGLDGQGERCMLAAALVQACESLNLAPQCWLLSRGAAAHLYDGDQGHALEAIADAAFWGFGRTLANESAHCRIRLIDLGHGAAIERLLPALLQADAETELALDAEGRRYVPRLRVLDDATTASDAAEQWLCLGFDLPGQLRNLRWEVREPRQPAADELDIAVRATGLNFRDVMFALGLLSDEAIENGFSGPTLGFEFAGVVQGKGAAVLGDFAPGDRVVGFGPCSFANRLVTNANAVARIPEGMSFEAAATIPSTFFTVYYALHHLARLEPGEKVLIHGAAGGVGIAAIQIAKWLGAEIHATAGSDEKRDFLRLLGVDNVYDSRSLAYADQVLAATGGRGVDVVLNSLAGEAINRNLRVLKPFGRFLELGKRDFYQNTRIGLRPFRNNISYFGIDADQLMSERPDLTRRLFGEMMALFEQGILHPLPFREFDANQVVEAYRYMQQARQIGKIVVTYGNRIEQTVDVRQQPARALQLDAEATYLVTGGLGGFGLRTAQWLVDKGARHLLLLGRRGPASVEAQPQLAQWQAQGIDVQAVACDITDAGQVRAVIAQIASTPWPLRGLVHAATVIDDGLIRNLDAEQLQRVLEPKAKGAQYLHEFTQGLALDFFVMFSSATTLFGNPGQANYVAANHWLEGLARHRRAHGLAATAVLWGAIDDVGFLARNEQIKDALQSRMGGAALRAEAALAQLEALLLDGDNGLGVLELDFKALSRFLPSAGSPRFVELARAHGGDQDDDNAGEDIQRMLAELDDAELLERFAEMLKHEVCEILRLPAARLDSQRPLQELGLDSLMSVELVVALEERFGIRLPVMELSESSSIDKLSVRLLELLRGEAGDGEEQLAQNVLARHGSELSAEQMAELNAELADATTAPNRLIE